MDDLRGTSAHDCREYVSYLQKFNTALLQANTYPHGLSKSPSIFCPVYFRSTTCIILCSFCPVHAVLELRTRQTALQIKMNLKQNRLAPSNLSPSSDISTTHATIVDWIMLQIDDAHMRARTHRLTTMSPTREQLIVKKLKKRKLKKFLAKFLSFCAFDLTFLCVRVV